MKEKIIIRRGNLISKKNEISFNFGFIYNANGVFMVDLYLEEEISKDRHKNLDLLRTIFSLESYTDDGKSLSVSNLLIKQIEHGKNKVSLICHGYVKCINDPQTEIDKKDLEIFYLELEGMNFCFSNFSEKTEFPTTNGFEKAEWDHTKGLLIYDGCSQNNFNYVIYKDKNSNNHIISFVQDQTKRQLKYEEYLSFKGELISLISFINGGDVRVRRESLGGYYIVNESYAQVEIQYSFSELDNKIVNDYVPISDSFYSNRRLLPKVSLFCFNNYVRLNRELDFNTIISYLNGATKVTSMEEAYFITIIAFERLAYMYDKSLGDSKDANHLESLFGIDLQGFSSSVK